MPWTSRKSHPTTNHLSLRRLTAYSVGPRAKPKAQRRRSLSRIKVPYAFDSSLFQFPASSDVWELSHGATLTVNPPVIQWRSRCAGANCAPAVDMESQESINRLTHKSSISDVINVLSRNAIVILCVVRKIICQSVGRHALPLDSISITDYYSSFVIDDHLIDEFLLSLFVYVGFHGCVSKTCMRGGPANEHPKMAEQIHEVAT